MSESITEQADKVLFNIFPPQEIAISRGDGVYIYDDKGKKYLDFTSGVAVNSLGHAHPGYIETALGQLEKIHHIPGTMASEPKIKCAQILTSESGLDRAFFCNSGTEANEAALKLARKKGKETRGDYCIEVISFTESFHGRSMGPLSVTGGPAANKSFEPMVPGTKFAKYNDLPSVEKLISENTAAIIVEPVQGESGVHPAKAEFLKGLRDICDENKITLIFDEVQTGIGRTGSLFAFQHYDVKPDIMTLAKGLGGGFPVGAMLACEETAKYFDVGSHGSTYGGNPLAMALSCFVLESVLEEGFLENVNECGKILQESLKDIQGSEKTIKDVRCIGLMAGVELDYPASEARNMCLKRGLMPWKSGNNVLRILPPLIITKNEVAEGLDILSDVLRKK